MAPKDSQAALTGMSRQHAAARAKFARDALASVRAKLAGTSSPGQQPLSIEAQVTLHVLLVLQSSTCCSHCRC